MYNSNGYYSVPKIPTFDAALTLSWPQIPPINSAAAAATPAPPRPVRTIMVAAAAAAAAVYAASPRKPSTRLHTSRLSSLPKDTTAVTTRAISFC